MLKIEIKTGNAAFGDGDNVSLEGKSELGRLIRKIATQVEVGLDSGNAIDINGNKCGHWELE